MTDLFQLETVVLSDFQLKKCVVRVKFVKWKYRAEIPPPQKMMWYYYILIKVIRLRLLGGAEEWGEPAESIQDLLGISLNVDKFI